MEQCQWKSNHHVLVFAQIMKHFQLTVEKFEIFVEGQVPNLCASNGIHFF